MKTKSKIILLVSFLVLVFIIFVSGCAQVSSPTLKLEEVKATGPSTPPREIRILTINVWSGLTYKGFFKMGEYQDNPEKRYEVLVSEIRNLSPDIISIQEANPLPHYAKRLATDLDYQVVYRIALGGVRFGPLGIPTNLREGDTILVKKPWTITDLGRKRLSGWGIATNWFCLHFGEMTQALLGRGMVSGKPLHIYAVHLHSGPFQGSALNAASESLAQEMSKEKVEEARKGMEKDVEVRRGEITNLIKFVEETLPPGMPAIILGDFNTTVESGELEPLLAGDKWVDTFRFKNPHQEGVTWDPPNNPNYRSAEAVKHPYGTLLAYHGSYSHRIDFILVNQNIPKDCIAESRVVLTPRDGFSASDHYGVLTTLKW
jgi:endonuclease/exonuclease/phosphatase family metal-dependent hydrolase